MSGLMVIYHGRIRKKINLKKHKFMSAGSNFVVTWVEFACPTLCAEPFFFEHNNQSIRPIFFVFAGFFAASSSSVNLLNSVANLALSGLF